MTLLSRWDCAPFVAGGITHDVYRLGSGPGVVVIPEIPGPTPAVVAFADEVVASGFTVVVAHLFGRVGASGGAEMVRSLAQVCVSREFTKLATGVTTPIASWLRALCRDLHESCGGPGVGVVGMCFTGGFALAAMVDPSVVAPVLSQPSVPFPVGSRRRADLNLSPSDLSAVKARVADGCPVLGLRFTGDPAVGDRFDTLARELGAGFIAVEFPGRRHSVLTEHRRAEGVARVLEFLHDRLDA
jgi:dienelactone hydrolase